MNLFENLFSFFIFYEIYVLFNSYITLIWFDFFLFFKEKHTYIWYYSFGFNLRELIPFSISEIISESHLSLTDFERLSSNNIHPLFSLRNKIRSTFNFKELWQIFQLLFNSNIALYSCVFFRLIANYNCNNTAYIDPLKAVFQSWDLQRRKVVEKCTWESLTD